MKRRSKVSRKSIKRRFRNKTRSNRKFKRQGGGPCDGRKGNLLTRCLDQQTQLARDAAADETQKPGYISKDGNNYFYKGTQLKPNQSVIRQGREGTFVVMDGEYKIRYKSAENMSQNQGIDPNLSIEIIEA
jgi:hypothetical protein